MKFVLPHSADLPVESLFRFRASLNAYSARNHFYYLLMSLGGYTVASLILHIWTRKAFPVHKKGIILLTGASSGIGRHTAEHLTKVGYTVVGTVISEKEMDELKSENIRNLIPIVVDVTNHDHCNTAINTIEKEMRARNLPLVAVVNNAGILYSGPTEFIPLEKGRLMFETNFWGAVDLVQQSIPLLRRSHGRIVNMSSFTGVAGTCSLFVIISGGNY